MGFDAWVNSAGRRDHGFPQGECGDDPRGGVYLCHGGGVTLPRDRSPEITFDLNGGREGEVCPHFQSTRSGRDCDALYPLDRKLTVSGFGGVNGARGGDEGFPRGQSRDLAGGGVDLSHSGEVARPCNRLGEASHDVDRCGNRPFLVLLQDERLGG